jgi:hypothetical protein
MGTLEGEGHGKIICYFPSLRVALCSTSPRTII